MYVNAYELSHVKRLYSCEQQLLLHIPNVLTECIYVVFSVSEIVIT